MHCAGFCEHSPHLISSKTFHFKALPVGIS